MSLERKKAIITGGRGFIGSYLSENLSRLGLQVRIFDLINGYDVTDRKAVFSEIGKGDLIFHLAGVLGTHELNDQAYRALVHNTLGAVNVYDAAREKGARVILAGKVNPWLNVYSITKEAAQKLATHYSLLLGVDIRVAQFHPLYGPGQKFEDVQKAVPTFIMRALRNEPIPVFGTGEQTADFIYVQDATAAMTLLGTRDDLFGEHIEIGTGIPTRIKDLAEMIIEICDSKSRVEYLPMRSGEPLNAHVVASTTKMKAKLSFEPKIDLRDGLEQTVKWYQWYYFRVNKTLYEFSSPQRVCHSEAES